MTSRLRALGGRINNIRTSELPKEKTRSEVICSIYFLDGVVQTFKVTVGMIHFPSTICRSSAFCLITRTGTQGVISFFPRWLISSKPFTQQVETPKPRVKERDVFRNTQPS
ncbi:hypothetical protein H8959_012163 [Pygathrix nigripes]